MSVAELTATAIRLESDCIDPSCSNLAFPLLGQLSSGRYTNPCSLMPLPASIDEWTQEHRTARKRAARCERDGYRFAIIDRALHINEIYEINTSAEIRQGRPMAEAYTQRPQLSPLPEYPCGRHRVSTYGVLSHGERLRAYTWVYRCGDLVMFSSILGHAQHLENHVMYLLIRGAIADQIQYGPGFCFYNMHDSGTDGLRFFKERCGFQPTRVEWQP